MSDIKIKQKGIHEILVIFRLLTNLLRTVLESRKQTDGISRI